MKLMTPEQMRMIDKRAIDEYSIPSILLMEHAAYNVFMSIKERYVHKNIVIVCGPGNNGGDGFALARQVEIWTDNNVKVLLAAKPSELSKDGKVYYDICRHTKIDIIQVVTENIETAYKELREADLIVDALFGTGLTRKIEGLYAEVICQMNASPAYTISIDIPSGIDGHTGKVQGIGVQADKTITFALPKIGLYVYPAIDYTGEVEVVDIGIPKAIIDRAETSFYSIDKEAVKKLLPRRSTRSNKGTYGKVLIVGGQTGMSGAVVLTSKAALMAGAGIVTAAVPKAIHDIIEQKTTEVLSVPLQDKEGHISKDADKELRELIERHDVIAIGPGIGRNEDIKHLLLMILLSDKPCVIDADALFFLREMLEILKVRKAPVIITPHPGEMSRLTHLSIDAILDNPLTITRDFAKNNHIVTALKIERTVVGDTEGNIYINRGGNSGMAKGGSGDVLTGIIAGLLAQKMMPKDAAVLGVYLHARAADIMKASRTEYTMIPSDLYKGLSKAFKEVVDI
jgi:NAD(P)H-hydrate epimerase